MLYLRTMLMLLLLCLEVSPSSAVVYVKWDSPGPAYDGNSWETAYHTVQQGIDDAAPDGEQVWVAQGTYVGSVTMGNRVGLYGGFAGNEVRLSQRDWTANETVLDANGSGSVIKVTEGAQNDTIIDGFTVRGSEAYEPGIHCYRSAPTISNNLITGNSFGVYCEWYTSLSHHTTIINNRIIGNSFSAVHCSDSADAQVIGNVISGNGGTGVYAETGGRAYVYRNVIENNHYAVGMGRWCSATVVCNLIRGNTVGGVSLNCSSGSVCNNLIVGNGSGVHIGEISECSISYNTLVGNGTGLRLETQNSSSAVGNIIAFNGIGLSVRDNDSVHLGCNCVYGNISGNDHASPLAGDVQDDPLFVDRQAGDYRLLPSSPCIDAGGYSASRQDMDGNPRPVDGNGHGYVRCDTGAYEYGPWLDGHRRSSPDGSLVAFGPVSATAVFASAGRIYVERKDRIAGIRVDTPRLVQRDQVLHIVGMMATDSETGERFVTALPDWPQTNFTRLAVEAIGLPNRSLGGGPCGLQEGIFGASGLNNLGLLTRTWGRVTQAGADYLYIDDGSNLMDGTSTGASPNVGVRVLCVPTGYSVGDRVEVNGISSCFSAPSGIARRILTRGTGDVRRITPW